MNKSKAHNHPSESNPEIEGLFRVGDRDSTKEIRIDQERFLRWVPSPDDNRLSEVAGWKDLEIDGEEGFRVLVLPTGLRSLETLLAGYESEQVEEKARALKFLTDYEAHVQALTQGKIDTSVTLETTAVTREGEFIVLPPHRLSDREEVIEWSEQIAFFAMRALNNSVNYTPKENLIEDFRDAARSVQ